MQGCPLNFVVASLWCSWCVRVLPSDGWTGWMATWTSELHKNRRMFAKIPRAEGQIPKSDVLVSVAAVSTTGVCSNHHHHHHHHHHDNHDNNNNNNNNAFNFVSPAWSSQVLRSLLEKKSQPVASSQGLQRHRLHLPSKSSPIFTSFRRLALDSSRCFASWKLKYLSRELDLKIKWAASRDNVRFVHFRSNFRERLRDVWPHLGLPTCLGNKNLCCLLFVVCSLWFVVCGLLFAVFGVHPRWTALWGPLCIHARFYATALCCWPSRCPKITKANSLPNYPPTKQIRLHSVGKLCLFLKSGCSLVASNDALH